MKTTLTTQLGRTYSIVKKLGSGGMADVFLAREDPSGPLVAVKVLPHDGLARKETLERFRREAVTSGRLRHRHIIPIRDLAIEHSPPFFVMDFAPSGSLAEKIRRHPTGMKEADILSISKQILLALDHAHRQRVIHRDIKPENILFDAMDNVLVSDFGLARILDDKTLTRQGALLGTPYYNSPELARGQKIFDGRCDLYSLGVILYEMATGQVPFDGIDAVGVCHRHVFEPPCPPSTIRKNLNPNMEKLILKTLEKQAGDRYQSAADMLSDLEAVERGDELDYDPLPGVLSLLETGPAEAAIDLERPRRGLVERFLWGRAERPPEPIAGLLVGIVLALVLWAGLSEFRPSSRLPSELPPLSRVGKYEPTASRREMQQPEADVWFLAPPDEPGMCRKIVVFPFEDRSGNSSLVRRLENAAAVALRFDDREVIAPKRLHNWQKEQKLTFSELFTDTRLADIAQNCDATHFVTGVLIREIPPQESHGITQLELEVSFYRFDGRAHMATIREIIPLASSDDDLARELSRWLGRRLLTPTEGRTQLEP